MNKVAPITINSPLNENSHKVNNGLFMNRIKHQIQ